MDFIVYYLRKIPIIFGFGPYNPLIILQCVTSPLWKFQPLINIKHNYHNAHSDVLKMEICNLSLKMLVIILFSLLVNTCGIYGQ